VTCLGRVEVGELDWTRFSSVYDWFAIINFHGEFCFQSFLEQSRIFKPLDVTLWMHWHLWRQVPDHRLTLCCQMVYLCHPRSRYTAQHTGTLDAIVRVHELGLFPAGMEGLLVEDEEEKRRLAPDKTWWCADGRNMKSAIQQNKNRESSAGCSSGMPNLNVGFLAGKRRRAAHKLVSAVGLLLSILLTFFDRFIQSCHFIEKLRELWRRPLFSRSRCIIWYCLSNNATILNLRSDVFHSPCHSFDWRSNSIVCLAPSNWYPLSHPHHDTTWILPVSALL